VIYLVCPHSRPEHRERLLASIARQTAEVLPVIVENGAAEGTFPPEWASAVLRSSVRHHAAAKNVALAWIRELGDGPWVTMDDDDYYGPDYAREAEAALLHADVTGKVRGFVSFDDGLWRFAPEFTGGDPGERTLTGGTIGARSAQLKFPVVLSDDATYCTAARCLGLSLLATPPHGYCYDRRSTHKHAWKATQVQARRCFGGSADYYGDVEPESVDMDPRPIARVTMPTVADVLADLKGAA